MLHVCGSVWRECVCVCVAKRGSVWRVRRALERHVLHVCRGAALELLELWLLPRSTDCEATPLSLRECMP